MRLIWIVIGAAILIILVTVFFFNSNKPKNTSNTNISNQSTSLVDYSDSDVTVSYEVDGIINSSELHRAIKITISKNSRMLEVRNGYQGSILQSTSFTNNQQAYKSFLAAIQNKGYSKQSKVKGPANIQGQCPLGKKYIFNTYGAKGIPSFLWTSSCAVAPGNFGGNLSAVQRLFQLQIPDYSKLTSGVNLN